jgi:hypothetical protein
MRQCGVEGFSFTAHLLLFFSMSGLFQQNPDRPEVALVSDLPTEPSILDILSVWLGSQFSTNYSEDSMCILQFLATLPQQMPDTYMLAW